MTTVEDVLADHSPAVRALVERLRPIVRAAMPEASERAYPVWRGIGYRHPQAGYVCAIFPQPDSVNLSFEWGVLLPDPDGLLQGTGKQVRYIPLRDGEDIPTAAIYRLIEAALSLPDGREAKVSLVRALGR